MDHAEHLHSGTAPAVPTIDPDSVELVETSVDDRPVLESLALFCAYDFSELIPRDVDETGTFGGPGPGMLRGCWVDPRRHTFLIRAGGKLAGFAIVDDHSKPPGAIRFRPAVVAARSLADAVERGVAPDDTGWWARYADADIVAAGARRVLG